MPDRSLNVFIVENHEDTLLYLTRYLEQQGHVVRNAGGMAEALTKLALEPADVLISDIGLPDGDGWLLMKNLQGAHRPYGIAMSGYGTREDCEKSRAAGFQHHLIKPFDPDELDGILSCFLNEGGATASQRTPCSEEQTR